MRQAIVIRDAKITWTGQQAGGSSVYLHLDARRFRASNHRRIGAPLQRR